MTGRAGAWRAFVVTAGLAFTLPSAAQPLLCDEVSQAAPADKAPVAPESIVGTYRCVGEGLSITLRLGADGRFEQRYEADAGSLNETERAEFEQAGRAGHWRLKNDRLFLFERPQRQPTIRLVASGADPSVWMRVEVRKDDGRPAQGLFIGEGINANPQSQLDDGVLIVPKTYAWAPGVRQIVRQGDDKKLFSFTPAEGGPNVFQSVYRPSEVGPFEIRAQVVDARAGIIAVPLGIGGALLKRVD